MNVSQKGTRKGFMRKTWLIGAAVAILCITVVYCILFTNSAGAKKIGQNVQVNDLTVTGKLYPGTGGSPLTGNNPYVWPVGLSNEDFYIGKINYEIAADGSYSVTVPNDFKGALITGADMHQTSFNAVINTPTEGKIVMDNIYLPKGNTTTLNSDSLGFKSIVLKAGSSISIPGVIDIPIVADVDLGKTFPAIGFAQSESESATIDFMSDGTAKYVYSNGDVNINAFLEATADSGYRFDKWNNELYSLNKDIPAASVKVVNPVFDTKFNVSGTLHQGSGSAGLTDKNPYVWPLGMSENKYYVGEINYDIDNAGNFKLALPVDFEGIVITGADMHQTSIHIAENNMGNIYLADGNTTTLNKDSEGFETLKLKAGSNIEIEGIGKIPIDADVDLGKNFPAIGFGSGSGESSTLDFSDAGIFKYIYTNETIGTKINANFETTAKENYHWTKWDNTYYTSNAEVPASTVKVINPVFEKTNLIVTGQLSAGTGSTGLTDKHPYVWPFGLSKEDVYVGDIDYDITADGTFKLVLPADFFGAILAGADMHQSTFVKIDKEDMGRIYLAAGNTTSLNENNEGFKSVVLKAGSVLGPVPISEDVDLGKKFPSIGFAAQSETEKATLDFKDDGIINYIYKNSDLEVNATLETTAETDYHFDKWENEFYETNSETPACNVKVISPIFAKGDKPVPPGPDPQPTPGPHSDTKAASDNAFGTAKTSDNYPLEILCLAVAFLVVTSGTVILVRKKLLSK